MAAPHRSAIGWTDFSGGDANFVTGCTPVSEGCRNCYARAIYERFRRDFSQVEWHVEKLERLARWWPANFVSKRDNPQQADRAWRPTVFVCDTGDLFHEAVPFEFISEAFSVMATRMSVDWQVLTKRPARMLEFVLWRGDGLPVSRNIWLGVTAENQETADERIPLLLEVPAAVRFVSVEPMLGPVDLSRYLLLTGASTAGPWRDALGRHRGGGGIGGQMLTSTPSGDIAWVICGAESGPNRRRFDPQWAVDLYYQCYEADVPYFYKQGSALRPGGDAELPGFGKVQEWPRC